MFLFPKSLSFLLLPAFLLLHSSSYYPLSHAASHFHLHTEHTSWPIDGDENGVNFRESRRSVVEGNKGKNSSLMILASNRTHRKDPLDDFNYYKGGWNISDEHYAASAVFTAAPLFLVAAIWFLVFALCFLFICLPFCCCRRHHYGYSTTAYAFPLIFLLLFTTATVIGCVLLYTGQGRLHRTTTDTLDFVVGQAATTAVNLNDIADCLDAAKRTRVSQVFLPQDVQNSIDHVKTLIKSSAATLATDTKRNRKDIQDVLDSVRLALIIIAAVMLLLALLGFLCSVLGMQFIVYVLVMMGWILVAGTFILCGVFLVLHNVMGDTCVAMNEWVQNPTAHTALDDILPCVDTATAEEALSQSKDVTYQLVNMVNRIITNVSNANFPGPLSYNQSGPLVPLLCNPFSTDMTDRSCASGEVDFKNATQVWKSYECQVSKGRTCSNMGRLTPDMYDEMCDAVKVSYGLHHYGPFLAGLLDCAFVRDTFSTIHDSRCSDLNQYSSWIYVGLAMVSSGVMLSLLFWLLYARERRHSKYTKLCDAAASARYNSSQRKKP